MRGMVKVFRRFSDCFRILASTRSLTYTQQALQTVGLSEESQEARTPKLVITTQSSDSSMRTGPSMAFVLVSNQSKQKTSRTPRHAHTNKQKGTEKTNPRQDWVVVGAS